MDPVLLDWMRRVARADGLAGAPLSDFVNIGDDKKTLSKEALVVINQTYETARNECASRRRPRV